MSEHEQDRSAAAGAPVGDAVAAPQAPGPEADHLGLLVEFDDSHALMKAAEKVRDAGFRNWDCHTPFPVHGLDQAMGVRPTVLPWIALAGGIAGGMTGLILQAYTNGIELPFSLLQSDSTLVNTFIAPFLPSGYPFVTSGKPIFSIPANVPIIFELTILLAAFGAFFGMLGLNKLPTFWHPVFTSQRFRRASSDRFFLSVEARDPVYDRDRVRPFLESLGGVHVEELEG